MKRRYRRALNVLSIGFLVFALYLNFVRKESGDITVPITLEKSGSSEVSHLEQASANLIAGHSEKESGVK